MQVGAGDVLDYVKRFGFDTSEFPRNTQLAIGGGTMGVTPLQMARAYATFANGGYLVEPNIVKEVKNMAGEVIYKANYPVVCKDCAPPPPTPITNEDGTATPADAVASDTPIPAPRVIDEGNAFIMNSMLQDVIKRGTAIRARSLNRNDIAGKTGTTNEADTWFNGYQKNLVASVWVGFSDHRPVGDNEYGSNSPLPIWIWSCCETTCALVGGGLALQRRQARGVPRRRPRHRLHRRHVAADNARLLRSRAPGWLNWVLIAVAATIWLFSIRWVWRSRFMERFFGLDD